MFKITPMIVARRTLFLGSLVLWILCVSGGFWASARAQEIQKDVASNRLEAMSRCDAWFANIQSLRQFKVYVDISRSCLVPFVEELTESSSQMVIEADLESKKFRFYRHDLKSVAKANSPERQFRCVKGATYDSKRMRDLRCSGRMTEDDYDFKTAWTVAEIPHVHAVGVKKFRNYSAIIGMA